MTSPERTRWAALYVLCAGTLMIVLDATIVNVALPSIQDDLGFTASSLAWVVNAYLIAFGGLLLLAGRAGDLLGQRNVFLAGLALFTVASIACTAGGSGGRTSRATMAAVPAASANAQRTIVSGRMRTRPTIACPAGLDLRRR